MRYDAIVLVSFGGPEAPDEVMPFLRNVVRGRGVPEARLMQVAEHYRHMGGVSPINQQCRDLLEALRSELASNAIDIPLFWGNRNWHPFLTDAVRAMRDQGVRRALAFVTSPYGSFSSCRQYLDDIDAARAEVEGAPEIDKIRHYHDHPGHVLPHADAVRSALAELSDVDPIRVVFTAHSIPSTMEAASGPDGGRYTAQLHEVAGLVAESAGAGKDWDLVWQSRSGPPHVPWLEPDINDHLSSLAAQGVRGVVVSPIGFISDHLEVVWDLDTEAAATAQQLGLHYVRAATPGVDPRFVTMVRELIQERLDPAVPVQRLGTVPIWDTCAAHCCGGPSPRPPAE